MAYQVKALRAKPDDRSVIPRVPGGRKRTNSCRLSFDMHSRAMACTCVRALTHMEINVI